ncbi:MAG: reverse transcriptase domain-containing protein, partial [Bacteroidota bacterium]
MACPRPNFVNESRHKKNRQILSMISSPQHKLAKYLNEVLLPVSKKYSKYTITDSFAFAKMIRGLESANTYMASFDVSSLFTNVPLMETINICVDAVQEASCSSLSRESLVELLQCATSCTEFSFNDLMYRQIDGVAMGSPLGPTLANTFIGFLEQKFYKDNDEPLVYCRYVDDIFVIFRTKEECEKSFAAFNALHSAIKFTIEHEVEGKLPFLDVLVERNKGKFLTSLYRKKTFTGQYVNFASHCSRKRKISLIKTLCHRAIAICSPERLHQELDTIVDVLVGNGYPEPLIKKTIRFHRQRLAEPKQFGPEKCTLPIKLPYLGTASARLENDLRRVTNNCFGAIEPRVIFTSTPIFSPAGKDRIPLMKTSMVVYHYK